MMTRRQELEKGFITADGCVDLMSMARTMKPETFREYLTLAGLERKGIKNPGRFNA